MSEVSQIRIKNAVVEIASESLTIEGGLTEEDATDLVDQKWSTFLDFKVLIDGGFEWDMTKEMGVTEINEPKEPKQNNDEIIAHNKEKQWQGGSIKFKVIDKFPIVHKVEGKTYRKYLFGKEERDKSIKYIDLAELNNQFKIVNAKEDLSNQEEWYQYTGKKILFKNPPEGKKQDDLLLEEIQKAGTKKYPCTPTKKCDQNDAVGKQIQITHIDKHEQEATRFQQKESSTFIIKIIQANKFKKKFKFKVQDKGAKKLEKENQVVRLNPDKDSDTQAIEVVQSDWDIFATIFNSFSPEEKNKSHLNLLRHNSKELNQFEFLIDINGHTIKNIQKEVQARIAECLYA